MTDRSTGLFLHRNSRTEALAERLAGALDAELPAEPLRPRTIVVAHPGLRRWLLGFLARRRGTGDAPGIAANIDTLLPGEWLESTRRRLFADDAAAVTGYRPDVLRWHVFAALRDFAAPELDRWLGSRDVERRRFELAAHLAAVYAQYLVYRPDWIDDWQHAPTTDWQGRLWRQVRARVGLAHRAERSAALLAGLAERGDGERDALHVFGVSHLPPDVLRCLVALSRHRAVHLYFPDPCRQHWSELRRLRDLLRLEADPQALHFEIGHPLLVSLGRMAQDFCIALDALDADDSDLEERADADTPAPALLQRLQGSIRDLDPERVGSAFRQAMAGAADRDALLREARADASLRVHACHTPLRELEVLRDALLGFLAADGDLQYADIVVMAPDIGAFAPYLAAVFGEPGRQGTEPLHLAWHLADTGLLRSHALISAFARLLDLADSRCAVSELLGLLDVPAVARRFAVDAEARQTLERWLRRANVAWGLDATMKADAGAAAVDANSWQFGLDRLYAGLLAGEIDRDELVDGVLPLGGVDGGDVEALGQLDRLLGELRRARTEYTHERPLADGAGFLSDLLDRLFRIDFADGGERAALDALQRAIGDLTRTAQDARLEQPLAWPVVREALRGSFDAVPERQPFLLGGVTFCGLVPQRSIPFKVVCLIGMNEGDFPRASVAGDLNRMTAAPRRGDRDTRSEDRYLFLEALMAARERLHVSYVGVGVEDGKARNPAAPLAEVLQFLDQQHGLRADDHAGRPWRITHALQPFAARYYRQAAAEPARDPRLFTFDTRFVGLDGAAAPGRFIELGAASAQPGGEREIGLVELKQFCRDPAKVVLRADLGIDLDALDEESWPDREPLSARADWRTFLEARLLETALADLDLALPERAPNSIARSGLLAAGGCGEQAYARVRGEVDDLLARVRDLPVFAGGDAKRCAFPVDVDCGDGLRLRGTVDRVWRGRDGSLLLLATKSRRDADFKDLLPLYLDLAALRLSGNATGASAALIENSAPLKSRLVIQPLVGIINAQTDAQLHAGLRRLIDLRVAAKARPPLFFPKTGWTLATTDADKLESRLADSWLSADFRRGERDYSPGYADLLTRDLDLLADPQARAELEQLTALVAGALDPERQILCAAVAPTARPRSRKGRR